MAEAYIIQRSVSFLRGPGILPILVLSALMGMACEPAETLYVDPPVDPSSEPPYTPMGPPTIDVGFYEEQLYRKLEPNDELRVINGSQGGTWTMPSVRVTGLDREVTVNATVTTNAGELVGRVSLQQRFVLATDGWLEIQVLPIPIRHAPPRTADSIMDLYGVPAVFSVQVADKEGRMTSIQLNVILAQG